MYKQKTFSSLRLKYDANKDYIMNTAEIMSKTGSPSPNLQLKVTAFMSGDLVVPAY